MILKGMIIEIGLQGVLILIAKAGSPPPTHVYTACYYYYSPPTFPSPPPDTPVAPHILSYNSSSPNSFRIEYIFSGIPTFVSNYTIEVQAPPHDQDNTPWIPLQTRSSNAVTAADVSSGVLEAFTLYKVRVVATYTTGIRVPSDVVMVTTGADTPLDAPRDVAVHAPNNMALSLTWKVVTCKCR